MSPRRRRRAKDKASARVVFLFDVDNTLLDNDRVIEDLRDFLRKEVGARRCTRYWRIFERRRSECGFADYLGALQRYREEHPHEMNLLAVSSYLIEYPFANRLFPNALDSIQHVQRWGQAVALTDGDVVFQPHKVQRSGLDDAFKGHTLVYIHKEKELGDVASRYPARHYVVIDDKLHILAAIKKTWKNRVTTVFVRQGHYAQDPKILRSNPPADLSIDRIGQLTDWDLRGLLVPTSTMRR